MNITGYEVIDNGFTVTITINPEHIVYLGHFPGHPVTPGVIQLQIVHELLEYHFQKNIKLVSVSDCRFLKVLNPEETKQLTVHAGYTLENGLLHIRATGNNGSFVFFKLSAVYRFLP